MKKTHFLLAFLMFAGLTMAQQVDRDRVVVEIGTGTW